MTKEKNVCTFNQLQEVDSLMANLYNKDKTLLNSKMGYAYKRFSEKYFFPIIKELEEKLQDIRVANAMENKDTKEILADKENARGYKYTKEGLLKCMKEERELLKEFEKREIEVEPFISAFVPKDLTEDEISLLKGILIAE